jgi:hypothetical protein
MTIYSRIKILSFAICLEACAYLPPFPAVNQCLYRYDKQAFYCVNTDTKAQVKIPIASPVMRAAQCVSADDYKKVQDWVSTVKQIAETRCR